MLPVRSRCHRRRGSTLVESAFALTSVALLLAGIMELGLTGLAANSVSFAAQRAARYASVRGSASGHVASVTDIQNTAQQYAAPLNPASLAVAVTWSPNNHPGSTVQVQVSYTFAHLLPISSRALTFQSTARQIILQ